MRKLLLVTTILCAAATARAQAVDLNLRAPVTNTGGPNQFLVGYPWGSSVGGGSQNTLSSNEESEWYSQTGVSTSNGDLVLTASPASATGANPGGLPFNSGAVSTAAMANSMPQPGGFQFDGSAGGTISITASLPVGPGLWPAIWLEPVSGQGACEVDLMEDPFDNANQYQASLHGGSGLGQVVNTSVPLTQQNTYSVSFAGNMLTYYFNGQQVAQAAKPAACNQQMYLLMNLAVGGNWPNQYGTPSPNTNASMVISNVAYTGPSGSYSGDLAGGLSTTSALADPPPVATSAVAPATDPPAASASAAPTPTTQAAASPTEIMPGSGSLTDCIGNVWTINSNNKILENGRPVPGGGDTSALTQSGCTIYGLSNGQNGSATGWFTLSSVDASGDQYWTTSPAPPGMPAPASAPAASVPLATTAANIPAATFTCSSAAPGLMALGGGSGGGFGTINGTIYSPNGTPFVPRGVDVHDNDLAAAAQQLPTQFPGINMVRVDVTSYADPSTFAAAVNTLTSQGIVVAFTDYTNSTGQDAGGGQGVVYTGAQLAAENAWFSSMASYFKNNPYVWLGTNNEPASSGGNVSSWQQSTYNAIRSTGNDNPILIDPTTASGPGNWTVGPNPSVYSTMSNVIIDAHFYGWVSGYSTDQSIVNQALASEISGLQQSAQSANGTMPVIIGEYGNSTSGTGVDANGQQVLNAVIGAAAKGIGSTAWTWDADATIGGPANDPNGDALLSGGQLTAMGQQVQQFIAGSGATGCAQTLIPNPALSQGTVTAPPLEPASPETAPALAPNTLSVPQVAALAATGTL